MQLCRQQQRSVIDYLWHQQEHDVIFASFCFSSCFSKMYVLIISLDIYFISLQPIKRKKEGEEKRMSQEEMLLEAAQTGLSRDVLIAGTFF